MAQVCRRLEGIPLAIELAAGRMGCSRQSSRLEARRFPQTPYWRPDGRPRHRTLRATLEWSDELLGEAERVLLGRLSVFAGGWTLEAAEEVCSGDGVEQGDVLEVLSELVDRSLVVAGQGRKGCRASGCWSRCASTARNACRRAGRRSGSGSATPDTTWRLRKRRSPA